MADEIGLDIEGVEGLLAELVEMSLIGDSPEFQDVMLDAAELTAENIRAEIPKLVEQHSGQLLEKTQASKYVGKGEGYIETAVVSEARTRRKEKGKENKGAPYPIFLEYGTEDEEGFTRIKARPFMRTGLDKSTDAVVGMIAAKLFGKKGA
ncbi:hypothetical protein LLH00_05990 [bacterium]|nr:hypothetical protein [bacterium]